MNPKFKLHIPEDTIKWPYVVAAGVLYLILLVSSYFLILKPQNSRYAILRQKQSALNELYLQVRAADIEQILQALQQEAAYLQQAQQLFIDRCLPGQETSRLLNDLNRLALKNNLKVQSIDPLPSNKVILAQYHQKAVSMRLTGNFTQLLYLLNDLSHLPYWLLLDNLNISQHPTGGETISLTVFTITR